MRQHYNQYFLLLALILLMQAISGIIGVFTAPINDIWYESLAKSSLTPAGWVFGVVWPLLYAMIAVAGWLIWKKRNHKGASTIITLFVIQLVLNWGWSFVFFTFHQTALGLIWIITILVIVIILLLKLYKFCFPAFGLLAPYALWLGFASYLSFIIWLQN